MTHIYYTDVVPPTDNDFSSRMRDPPLAAKMETKYVDGIEKYRTPCTAQRIPRLEKPQHSVVTLRGLFPPHFLPPLGAQNKEGNFLYPTDGVSFLGLDDAFLLQAFFGAGQLLTARLNEQPDIMDLLDPCPSPSRILDETNPVLFLDAELKQLAIRLSLIESRLYHSGNHHIHTSDRIRDIAEDFKIDFARYAPWLEFEVFDDAQKLEAWPKRYWPHIRRAQAALRDACGLAQGYQDAQRSFVAAVNYHV